MGDEKLGIGQVRKILAEEFPDITISKIRFLEKEGLITVERTSSGYRKFSKEDIQKLRFILRLQKEQYLPLEVIKKKIKDLEHGKVTAADLVTGLGEPGEDEVLTSSMSVTVDAAPNKLGMTPRTIQELIDHKLVTVHDGEEGEHFKPEDVAILRLAKRFARFGIEARHLRMYAQFTNRQAAFFEQIVRPQLQHKDSTVKRSAYRDLEDLIELSRMMQDLLLKNRLKEYLPGRVSVVTVAGDRDEVAEKGEQEAVEGETEEDGAEEEEKGEEEVEIEQEEREEPGEQEEYVEVTDELFPD